MTILLFCIFSNYFPKSIVFPFWWRLIPISSYFKSNGMLCGSILSTSLSNPVLSSDIELSSYLAPFFLLKLLKNSTPYIYFCSSFYLMSFRFSTYLYFSLKTKSFSVFYSSLNGLIERFGSNKSLNLLWTIVGKTILASSSFF